MGLHGRIVGSVVANGNGDKGVRKRGSTDHEEKNKEK